MHTKLNRASCGLAALATAICGSAAADGLGPIGGAFSEAKPIFDSRLRFEDVDQDPFADEAQALTWRTRLGFETGKAWETALLVEGEALVPVRTDYNSTTNGRTRFPAVPDPESYEINRLQLTNTRLPLTTITLGRQRIALDDHRFVGNVGWRQNEQTFDSLRIVNRGFANVIVDLAYVRQVNRIFGSKSPQGRYEGDSLLANLSYQLPVGRLTGFGYWLDFEPVAGVPGAVRDSVQTLGVRFAGERALSRTRISYVASYATQKEYADNPVVFDNDYRLIEITATYRQYHWGLGQEVLEGNGTKGFTTPLATLHKFQGWADKFLTTPPNGIDDRYVHAGVTLKGLGVLDTLSLQASYHTYEAERTAVDYGSELDLQLQAKWRRLLATLKYADYDAEGLFTNTAKLWAQVEYVW